MSAPLEVTDKLPLMVEAPRSVAIAFTNVALLALVRLTAPVRLFAEPRLITLPAPVEVTDVVPGTVNTPD